MKLLSKAIALTSLVFSATTFAAGWSFTSQQGTFELYGAAKNGYALFADCNTDNPIPDIGLYVQLPGSQVIDLQADAAPDITVIVDGEKMSLSGVNSMVGQNNYNYFWRAVRAAKNKAVTVVLPDGKRFTVPGNDIDSVLFKGNESCTVG